MSFYKRIKQRIAKRVINRDKIGELKVGDKVNYHTKPEGPISSSYHTVVEILPVDGGETVVYLLGHQGPVLISQLSQSGDWIE